MLAAPDPRPAPRAPHLGDRDSGGGPQEPSKWEGIWLDDTAWRRRAGELYAGGVAASPAAAPLPSAPGRSAWANNLR